MPFFVLSMRIAKGRRSRDRAQAVPLSSVLKPQCDSSYKTQSERIAGIADVWSEGAAFVIMGLRGNSPHSVEICWNAELPC